MDCNIKGIRNRRVVFTAFMAIAVLSLPVRVSAGVIPKDLPTIEALIALHKAVKKDEDKAMQRVAASFGEQSLLTKGAGPASASSRSSPRGPASSTTCAPP